MSGSGTTLGTSILPEPAQQKSDVGPALKQDHGQGAHRKPSEIIRDYMLQQTGDQKAADAMIRAVADLAQKKVGRIVQFGNTLFFAIQKGRGTVDVHIFTEENPVLLTRRLKEAYAWAKSKGFTTITSTLTDGNFAHLIKTAGLPYTLTQTTVNDGKKMTPGYQLTVQVR